LANDGLKLNGFNPFIFFTSFDVAACWRWAGGVLAAEPAAREIDSEVSY